MPELPLKQYFKKSEIMIYWVFLAVITVVLFLTAQVWQQVVLILYIIPVTLAGMRGPPWLGLVFAVLG